MTKKVTVTIEEHELASGKYPVVMVRDGYAYVEVAKGEPLQAYTLPDGDYVVSTIKEFTVSTEGVCEFKASAKGAKTTERGTSPDTLGGKAIY